MSEPITISIGNRVVPAGRADTTSQLPQWQPIEYDQIRAGMRIRATTVFGDGATNLTGVYPTIYEVDPATIPDPDAELIETVAEALAGVTITDPDFDGLECEDWRELARAALTAIRESEATA